MVGTLQDQGSLEPIPVRNSCRTSLLEKLHTSTVAFLHVYSYTHTLAFYSPTRTRLLYINTFKEFVKVETVPPLIIGHCEGKVELVIDGVRIFEFFCHPIEPRR